MPLSSGCHHVALVTQDLARFIDFYRRVFDAQVRVEIDEPGLRHALVDLGGGFCLHPFELADASPSAVGSDTIFQRGHLDHLAINVDDPDSFDLLRTRLVDVGASDGTLTDFGPIRTVWFEDPDGMGCEIATWATGPARTFEDRIREPYAATG